jgi:hypothetical protein
VDVCSRDLVTDTSTVSSLGEPCLEIGRELCWAIFSLSGSTTVEDE